MAVPHGKTLRGKEAGNKAQHWYDYLESKKRILRSRKWMGPRTKTKPGVKIMIWLGFDPETAQPRWGSIS